MARPFIFALLVASVVVFSSQAVRDQELEGPRSDKQPEERTRASAGVRTPGLNRDDQLEERPSSRGSRTAGSSPFKWLPSAFSQLAAEHATKTFSSWDEVLSAKTRSAPQHVSQHFGSWLYTFVACTLALSGLRQALNQYRMTTEFRKNMEASGFLQAPIDCPQEEAASIMRKLLYSHPTTVSELVQDTASNHGMAFKAYMMTAGVFSTLTNYDVLMPGEKSAFDDAFNYMCHALLVFGIFGFPLNPSPLSQLKGYQVIYDRYSCNDDPVITDEDVAKEFSNSHASSNHQLFALPIFLGLPSLELIASVRNMYWLFVRYDGGSRLISFDPVVIAWLTIGLVRASLCIKIGLLFTGFIDVLAAGMAQRGKLLAWRSFSSEYVNCELFALMMRLLPVQAWFDFSEPRYNQQHPLVKITMLASAFYLTCDTLHVAYIRINDMLMDVSSSERDEELKDMFQQWKKQYKVDFERQREELKNFVIQTRKQLEETERDSK